MGGTVGLVLACTENDDVTPPSDCWERDGDATCAEVFGDARPYCSTDAPPCGVRAQYGCVAERPASDICYSPCGNGQSLVENGDCEDQADGGGGRPPGSRDDFDDGELCGNAKVDDGEECDDGN
ncbi:MAG TPA: hypothetical protein VK034_10660, partial [Enhygromyxa sp.]|nr:hypothetical protein [Enhygromyxa sp.]